MEKLALLLLLKKRKAMRNRQFNQTFVIDHLYYLSFFSFSDYQFKCLFRMTQMQFQSLYQILLRFNHQKPVSKLELLIYLYRMAHGNGFRAVGSFFKVCASFANTSFWKVVELIVKNKQYFIHYPSQEEFDDIAQGFAVKNGRYDIIGAMDGTFIRINQPSEHGSFYYNRKGFYAIHMLAVCDWSLRFWYVQARDPGNTHDSIAFLQGSLYADIMNNEFNLNHDGQMFKLLTDSAFRRQPFIIKTNATDFHRRRMFLSQHKDLSNESARTCIECIFGVMVNRWQIFGKRIIDTTDRVKWLVVSGCCIHNYLQ